LTRRKTVPARGQRPGTAAHARRQARLVSLVRVQAVTPPAGAPAPAPDVVYLRVHATRVTTTSAGRPVASGGATTQLTRSGSRRPAGAVLCC
jgi:hypothetical protein